MVDLRKQIKESFFNPVLYFLPLLVFLLTDDFLGRRVGWAVSFPIAVALVVYVYWFYKSIYRWHLFATFLFVVYCSFVTVFPLRLLGHFFVVVFDEIVSIIILLLLIIFRKQVEKLIHRIMPKLLPMTNNIHELYKVVWGFLIILSGYVSLSAVFYFSATTGFNKHNITYLHNVYILILSFFVIAEMLHVMAIRSKLLKEEWWPIVNNQGKIIGSIQQQLSLTDCKKYIHPVVRIMVIDNGMIFLQKRAHTDIISPCMWDTAISNHIIMNETIEECIDRTIEQRYGIREIKSIFISNYILEFEKESHYVFLFLTCSLKNIQLNAQFIEHTKWWTPQQIEANIKDGIFSDEFITEYELLKRSGLLESGKCECQCRLRDEIFRNLN